MRRQRGRPSPGRHSRQVCRVRAHPALPVSCPAIPARREPSPTAPVQLAAPCSAEVLSSKARGGHGPSPSHSSLSPAFPFPSPQGGKPARGGDAVPRYQNDEHPPTACYMAVVGVCPHRVCPATGCTLCCDQHPPRHTPRTTTSLRFPRSASNATLKKKANSSKCGAAQSKDRRRVTNPHWDPHAPCLQPAGALPK